MNFTTRRPTGRVQTVVDRVWHIEDATPSAATICPDGRTEIVLHLGDPMRGQHRHLLVAQMDRPITIVPRGRVAMVGARFRPGALHKVLPVAQDQLAGRILDLESVWQQWTLHAAERVAAVDDADSRLAVFETVLQDIVPLDTTRSSDVRLDAALVTLRWSGGNARIDRLADEAGLCRRQFERRFREYVGLSPRLFGRIVKFQRAFHLLGVDHGASIAARCGYRSSPPRPRNPPVWRADSIGPGGRRRLDRLFSRITARCRVSQIDKPAASGTHRIGAEEW